MAEQDFDVNMFTNSSDGFSLAGPDRRYGDTRERCTAECGVLQDVNMMCFGGLERIQDPWKSLLGGAGWKIVKFWAGEGNLQHVIEARLQAYSQGSPRLEP